MVEGVVLPRCQPVAEQPGLDHLALGLALGHVPPGDDGLGRAARRLALDPRGLGQAGQQILPRLVEIDLAQLAPNGDIDLDPVQRHGQPRPAPLERQLAVRHLVGRCGDRTLARQRRLDRGLGVAVEGRVRPGPVEKAHRQHGGGGADPEHENERGTALAPGRRGAQPHCGLAPEAPMQLAAVSISSRTTSPAVSGSCSCANRTATGSRGSPAQSSCQTGGSRGAGGPK